MVKFLCLISLFVPIVFGFERPWLPCGKWISFCELRLYSYHRLWQLYWLITPVYDSIENNETAPRAVRFHNCDKSSTLCDVSRGQLAHMRVLFHADRPSQQVRVDAEMRHQISQRVIPFTFDGERANLCKHIRNSKRPDKPIKCPLTRGQNYFWTSDFKVPTQAPISSPLEVIFRARNNQQRIIFCFVLKVRINNWKTKRMFF